MSSNHKSRPYEDVITFDYQEGEAYVIDIWNFRGKLQSAKVGQVAAHRRICGS